jgi:hypothetical protein
MKKKAIVITFIIIVFIIVLATIIIKIWPSANNSDEVKIINRIDGYGYILEDNKTALHKKYFDELTDVLNADQIDEEEYAKLVVKLFISDFYNLSNKITKNDIGGTQYVYSEARDNMILKAKDTIYKYVENNINNTRKQSLPVVSDIEITSIDQIDFEYGDKTDDKAYEIVATWSYKEDLGYQSDATIILIHEDQKLTIAELQ